MKMRALKKMGFLLATLAAVASSQAAFANHSHHSHHSHVSQNPVSVNDVITDAQWVQIHQSSNLWVILSSDLHDIILTSTVPPTNAAAQAALIAALNQDIAADAQNIQNFLAQFKPDPNLATLIDLFAVAEQNYLAALVAGSPLASTVFYPAWLTAGTNLAQNLAAFYDVSFNTIQSAINQFISAQINEMSSYLSGNYSAAIGFRKQSTAVAAAIGAYIAASEIVESFDNSVFPPQVNSIPLITINP